MVSRSYRPHGASSEPKDLGLLVKRMETRAADSVPEFPNLGRLSRLHFRAVLAAARLERMFLFAREAWTKSARRWIPFHNQIVPLDHSTEAEFKF